jgi:hypothetical protein
MLPLGGIYRKNTIDFFTAQDFVYFFWKKSKIRSLAFKPKETGGLWQQEMSAILK